MTSGGYEPFPTIPTGSPWAAPEQPSADASFEMMAALIAQQQMPASLTPRLPAHTLWKFYQAWETNKKTEIHNAFIAARYYHNKQWTDEEIAQLKLRNQPVTTKNRIKRKVDFLVGVEQRLRRDPKAYPRHPGAEESAPRATACLRYVEDDNKWPSVASECSSDALIRGIGAQWAGVKVIKGRAEVRKHQVPSDRFFYDPRSTKPDFSDARYLGEHQWLDIDEAVELLPFAEEMIESLASCGKSGDMSLLPQEFAKEHNWIDWVDSTKRRIRLVSIWYRCKGRWMFDFIVGSVSLCPEEMDCLSPYWHEDDDGDEGQRDHPYRAWSPYVDESGERYGVVRDMISIQDEINKRSSKSLHLLTVNLTIGEKGAVDDVAKMKLEKSRGDGHIERNPGMELEFVDNSREVQGNLELLQEAKAEIENLGPNPGLLGRGVEQQSGRAILAQQNSGMTELSPVFERQREWKLACYRKDWVLMRQFWSAERYVRITSDPQALEFLAVNRVVEDGSGAIRMENAIAEMDVDIILDEGPDTITMREELIEAISDRQDIPTEFIIELSNLPEKDMLLRKMKEYKAPPPEMIAMQERMAKLEEWKAASEVDKNVATADKARADTMAVLAPIGANTMMLASEFPVHYREPSFVDQNRMANAASAQMGQGQQGGDGQSPQPQGGPEQVQEFGNPQPQNPMMSQEPPQPGQPGALPLGPGVGQPH